VKTGAQVYQEDVLQGVLKHLNTNVFNGQKWVFQQDSAPAHKAKTTQGWLWRNVPAFISAEDWHSLCLLPNYKAFHTAVKNTNMLTPSCKVPKFLSNSNLT